MIKKGLVCWLAGFLLGMGNLAQAKVVGAREPMGSLNVGIRGIVLGGSEISGIRFYVSVR